MPRQTLSAPILPSLIGYWAFDDSRTTVRDRSAFANDGFWQGAVGQQWTRGMLGNASKFNGSNNYLLTNKSTTLYDGTLSSVTVAGWLNPATIAGMQAISKGGGTVVGGGGWTMGITAGGNVTATTKTSSGANAATRNSSSAISANTFTFFTITLTLDTVTLGNNNITITINGSSNQGALTNSALPKASAANLKIGARGEDGSPVGFFNGSIDEVRIFNRALTAAEILYLYSSSRLLNYNTML